MIRPTSLTDNTNPEYRRGSIPDEETRLVTMLGIWMREKLRRNSHKAHWRSGVEPLYYFLRRARVELIELEEAVELALRQPTQMNFDNVKSEAADVANFVAMVADIVENGYMDGEDNLTLLHDRQEAETND